MGGGSKSTVTKEKAEPWGEAQPSLVNALAGADQLYGNNGFAPPTFTQATGRSPIAQRSGNTMRGMENIANIAMNDMEGGVGLFRNSTGAINRAANMSNSPELEAAYGGLSDAMGASSLDGVGGFLGEMMSGRTGGAAFDQAKSNALDEAVSGASGAFVNSGMMNSGQAMDTVGRAATEAIAPFEYQAAESNLARQMQAAGAIQSGNQADISADLSGAGTMGQLAGNEQDQALRAAYLSPQAYSSRFMPGQMLQQVGQQRDQYAQSVRDASVDNYNTASMRPADNLMQYANLAAMMGGQGGTSTGKSTAPGPGAAETTLGAGLTGLGTYGTLASMGMGGPIGIAGGIGAGLLGLF